MDYETYFENFEDVYTSDEDFEFSQRLVDFAQLVEQGEDYK